MTGSYSEQAQLANTNDFISTVQRAMLDWAIGKYYSVDMVAFKELEQARAILYSNASDAGRIASLIVAADPDIKSAAPSIPTDAKIVSVLETVLDALLK